MRLGAMGLELFGDRANSVPMITLVRVPEGIDERLVGEYGIGSCRL